MCSLCGKKKEASPLDTKDFVFGLYVSIMRKAGAAKHSGQLGICGRCMPGYLEMQSAYQKKKLVLGALALVFAVLYFYFSNNLAAALIAAIFIFSLSFFSYCPPLKK